MTMKRNEIKKTKWGRSVKMAGHPIEAGKKNEQPKKRTIVSGE